MKKLGYTKLSNIPLNLLLPVGVFGALIVVFGAVVLFYIGAIETAKQETLRAAEEVAVEMEKEIQSALDASEYLANSFSTLEGKRTQVNSMLQVVLLQNERFEGVYSIWEPNEFDQMDTAFVGLHGHDETGRFMPYWTRDELGYVTIQTSIDYETSIGGNYYVVPKQTLNKALIDPFIYPSKNGDVFMVAAVCPIKYGRNFYGVAGINIKIATLQRMVSDMVFFDRQEQISVFSNDGTYVVAQSDPTLLGKNIADLVENAEPFLNEITRSETIVERDGLDIVAYKPVLSKGVLTPWRVIFRVPLLKVLDGGMQFRFWMFIVFASLFFVFIVYSMYMYLRNKLQPITKLVEYSESALKGDLSASVLRTNNEIETISRKIYLRRQKDKNMIAVLDAVVNGNYNKRVEPDSAKDFLSLKLNEALAVLEKREQESQQKLNAAAEQEWIRDGISEINRVLRTHFKSFEELAADVVKVLVNYLGINQGGLFVLMENKGRKSYLELKAAYAYNKHKAQQKRVNFGDGIVGTCALEKELTYLTEIPESYPAISSGLGEKLPSAVVVTPLIHENIVYGVLELASFSKFTKKEIELLQNVTEPIAAAIASMKINEQTSNLLAEMQKQREELLEQEKSTRENLEKLKQTQERANLTESRLRRELESARLEAIRLKTSMFLEEK